MGFIIEDGSGIAQANAYASVSHVTGYLTDRNRAAENGWEDQDLAVKQAAIVAATDYIESRYRAWFRGQKQYTDLKLAKAVLTFTVNPTDGTQVGLGSKTYTFNAALGGADSIQIASTLSGSIDNLIRAINLTSGYAGISYGIGTTAHPDASAREFEGDAMVAEALLEGSFGNSLAATTTVIGATWSSATLIGGTDTGRPQPLSFPRAYLYDRDGVPVVGIPDRLRQAVAEYAVRSIVGPLQPDPDQTSGAQIIEKEEVVGPIKERTKWLEGGRVQTIIPYPAADGLLCEFLIPGGSVVRS